MAALAAAMLVGGCATAPMTYHVTNTAVVPEPRDVVWERVVEFFATNNMPIQAIERDSGLIAAERQFARPSSPGMIMDWASCGSEALAIVTAQSADLNVFVRTVPAGTSVTVNTRFNETRSFDTQSWTVECNSTGALESLVLRRAAGN